MLPGGSQNQQVWRLSGGVSDRLVTEVRIQPEFRPFAGG